MGMANNKRIGRICTIQRALGIIEGIASNLENCEVRQLLYTATEMIEEAVTEDMNDDNG